ncbi:MAG: hypothetical protein Q4P36_03330 [Bowdeniella nasicola]|nr:hypothetical protein [Bowdeniella nasicola]
MNTSPVIENYPHAPRPTARTLWMRRSLPIQAVKFAGSCLTIMMMVAKGHGGED